MQTRLIDSLQLDAYAGRRWTVRRQRWTVRRRRRRTVPAYEACMQPACRVSTSESPVSTSVCSLHAGCMQAA